MKVLVLATVFSMISFSYANEKEQKAVKSDVESNEADKTDLTQIMKDMTLTYSQVAYMKSSVIKKQKSLILGTEEKTSAQLEYSLGKMRLAFETKPETQLIMGDKKFWQISGKEVNEGQIDKKNFPNIFLDIFSKPEVWDDIKLKQSFESGEKLGVTVDTKGKFSWLNELNITIDRKRKTIVNLKYVDDVQNEVQFDFKRTRFKEKAPKGRFFYKPKKGDVVNKL